MSALRPHSQRLDNIFRKLRDKNEGALVAFVTAGDPSIEGTPRLVTALAEAGADVIELGVPYSDPMADGPTVQASSQRALDRGVTPETVLQMVRDIRQTSDVPLVLMTSYNLVLRYGLNRFAKVASEAGVDGAILSDLPPEEAEHWKREADAHGLATIFLVAPTSTPERIRRIAQCTTGFVYCVSRTGVTGARQELPVELQETLTRIRESTDKPVCVGFGVSTPAHVAQVVAMADGAVIGSALVDFLHHNSGSLTQEQDVRRLVSEWKEATRRRP
jgi:tryptophan synthase alpha chain